MFYFANVNKSWLRQGEGKKYIKETTEFQIVIQEEG